MRLGVLIAFFGSLFMGFLPLFAGFSYESALGTGVWLPGLAAWVASGEVLKDRRLPLDAYLASLSAATILLGINLLVTFLHGARVGHCDFWPNFASFLLGPSFGCLLGAAWGALATFAAFEVFGRVPVLVRWGLAASAPLLGIVLSLWRFYSSPMVFAFDPFFGHFSGTLYDTIITTDERLVTYRAGSLASLLALGLLCQCLYRDAQARLRWRLRVAAGPARWRLNALHLGLCLAVSASLGITLSGKALGHYQSRESVVQELGHLATSERCSVVYATGIRKRDAHALARECDGHVRQLESYFDVRVAAAPTVFLFNSAEQKGALMGASNTYVAKPWRNEVYLQAASYPHPVLGHELAHVVAGAFAPGPFKVAGPWGGWIPDPGRIEGFAVAASPSADSPLSLLEWAGAMHQRQLLPPLRQIFRLGFLAHNSATAYTAAGAFVAWLHQRNGPEALRRWYAGVRPRASFQADLSQLEAEFVQALSQLDLSEAALRAASARFDQPAVFGRRCPHTVDQLEQEAAVTLGQFDPGAARELYRQALALDPRDVSARFGLGSCARREGDVPGFQAILRDLKSDESLHHLERAYAAMQLGDAALFSGALKEAVTEYEFARASVVDEGTLRELDVKVFAGTQATPLGSRAVAELLIGDAELGHDLVLSSSELGNWAAQEPQEGLPLYLLGKNLFLRGRWSEAFHHLQQALARGLKNVPRVEREALRVQLFAACALGDVAAAQSAFESYLEDSQLSSAARTAARGLAQRCGLSSPVGVP